MNKVKYFVFFVAILLIGGGASVSHAALTISGNSIVGDSNSFLDATGTISIGTSTATGIAIGNPSSTITLYGPVTISATTTIQNLTTSQLTISSLIGSSTQCLQVNGSGTVSGTGAPCGSGGGGLPAGLTFATTTTSGSSSVFSINSIPVAPSIVTNGLICEYNFTEGTGTVVHDISGNGNNGTLGGSIIPTWIPVTGGLNTAKGGNNASYVTLSSGCNTTKSAQLFITDTANVSTGLVGNQAPSLIAGSGGNTLLWIFPSQFNFLGNFSGMTTFPASQLEGSMFGGTGSVAWVTGGSSDSLYINANQLYNYNSAPTNIQTKLASTGGTLNIGGNDGVGVSTAFEGNVYYALFYNRTLTSAEVQQNSIALAAIMAQRGVVSTANPQIYSSDINATAPGTILVDGDSITAGLSGTPYINYFANSSPLIYPTSNIFNIAMSGAPCNQLITNAPLVGDSTLSTIQSSFNIEVLWCGTNDLVEGSTPISTFNLIKQYAAARHAAGWKFIVATMINRSGVATSIQNTYNDLIRENWKSFADGISDVAASPNLGAAGASANTTYFNVDATHPQTYSDQNIIAPIMANAINLLSSEQNYPNISNYTTSTNYSMQSSATTPASNMTAYLRADPANASGNITVTLPSAVGLDGDFITIQNISASSSNTLTVVPTSSTPIDGNMTELINQGLSYVIPVNTAVKFWAVDNAASTGGATWQLIP